MTAEEGKNKNGLPTKKLAGFNYSKREKQPKKSKQGGGHG